MDQKKKCLGRGSKEVVCGSELRLSRAELQNDCGRMEAGSGAD